MEDKTIRLDHIAYRVKNRHKTANFFIEAFGYKIQQEFPIDFGDGYFAQCIAPEPPEKIGPHPWTSTLHYPRPDLQQEAFKQGKIISIPEDYVEYHMAPEIFVSDGDPGSIVGDWVEKRDGIGGIHHMAYQVENVEGKMREWKEKGYAEFSTDAPIKCPGLTQVFTKPSFLTGIIYEFIKREEFGFCAENVRALMESTKGL